MQITNKGKTVTLNKTERAPLEKAKELLDNLAVLPFTGKNAAERAIVDIGTVLAATAKPVPADEEGAPVDTDSDKTEAADGVGRPMTAKERSVAAAGSNEEEKPIRGLKPRDSDGKK